MARSKFVLLNDNNHGVIEDFFIENDKIYRYLPLERFLEILHSNSLVFVSPKKWSDPFDSFLFHQIDESNSSSFLNKLFVGCFTQNPHSHAYWKTYAPEGYSVRITLSVKELLKTLFNSNYKIWIGKMNYLLERDFIAEIENIPGLFESLSQNSVSDSFLKAFTLKRKPFEYEEELRIIVQSEPNQTGLKKIKINTKALIKDIYLDPRIGPNEEKALKEYLKKFSIQVRQSQLLRSKKIKIQ